MSKNEPGEPTRLWISATSTSLPLPPGWTKVEGVGAPMVRGPEGDIEVAFVMLPAMTSDGETASEAWRRLNCGHELKPLQDQDVPVTDGWDRAHQFLYNVRGRDDALAAASLRVAGDAVFVNLIVASKAGFDRRMAQVMQLIQAWRPDGMQAEDLSGREIRPWGEHERQAITAFVRSGMDALHIPGMAMAIVQDGRIVECQGFGSCGIDAQEPVTGDTRFMIGSISKALTTLMMARLIDQGRFAWSTPVIKLMPDFAFADADMTRRLEMRHTVSASTGMPRSDMELAFQADGNDPERCLARLKRLRPTTGFGETFQYSNQLVALGGFAAAKAAAPASGLADAYRQTMHEQVFEPLCMNATVLHQPASDRALAHALNLQGVARPLDMHMESFVECVAPAGAIWSTARDMAHYLQMELSGGRDAKAGSYIDRDRLRERYEPQIRTGRESSYGLGLGLSRTSGLRQIGHNGGTLGFSADMWFLPEQQVGVVLLANLAQVHDFLAAIDQKIRELLFDAQEKSDEWLALAVASRETAVKELGKRIGTDAQAQDWIADLAGTYVSDELGRAEIRRSGQGHQIHFPAWSSELAVFELADTEMRRLALISPPWRGDFRFRVEDAGRILICAVGQQQYAFKRQTD